MRVLFIKSWNDEQPNGDNVHYRAGIERDVDADVAQRAMQAGRALDVRVANAMETAAEVEGRALDSGEIMDAPDDDVLDNV